MVKLLHTSDWHVGKAIRGHSRAGEHREVLAEIAGIAASESVDATIVAGDLFDSSAPTAESEGVVYDALLALAEVAPVVVISGNHDSTRRLDAVSRLLALGRVTVATTPRRPDDGGIVEVDGVDGTPIRVAAVPFVSQRAIVRSEALMSQPAFRNAQTYADRMAAVLAALGSALGPDAVNVVAAHLFVTGGAAGGGERAAHLVDEYGVSAVDFPLTASYVALGHLHRAQSLAGPTAIHYCGSPLQLDFGETEEPKQVNLVVAEPGIPAKVTPHLLRSGRRLRTVQGSIDDLRHLAGIDQTLVGAWLRVRVTEPTRVGLADEVRDALGDGVVEVRVADPGPGDRRSPAHRRRGRSPAELFADYLTERDILDPRLNTTFAQLHDELSSPDEEPQPDTGGGPLDLTAASPSPSAEQAGGPRQLVIGP
jgi:exonuclease SbcD